MAAELRDFYNATVIRDIGTDLRRAWAGFDEAAFVRQASKGLEPLSLTERAAHIADAMRAHLPDDFDKAGRIILKSLGTRHASTETFGMAPFKYLPHTMFVASHGLAHFELSMQLQYEITQRFTAEFSIRAFLNAHPAETMARLTQWATDTDPHVRRLVSEGTRPRLPWAPRLRHFQQDPTPVLALLEMLKDDPELYVRRSVANSLNDIAKDHPELVVDRCRTWLADASAERRWIVAHALRSLVKAGHQGALTLLGAGSAPKVAVENTRITPTRQPIGGAVTVTAALISTSKKTQDLLIDYAVHYVKADGRTSPKVFKLKRVALGPGAKVDVRLTVKLKNLTTRTHYPGVHAVELRINGRAFPLGTFRVVAY